MKKFGYLFTIFVLVLCMAGCEETQEETTTQRLDSVAEGNVTAVKPPEAYPVVTDRTKFQPVTEEQAFQFETDDQVYIGERVNCAETTNAYYYTFPPLMEIYMFDKESQKAQVFCNKPECGHNDSTCNARLGNANGLMYYKGYLYSLVSEIEEGTEDSTKVKVNLVLYRISLDSSERKAICTLASTLFDADDIEHQVLGYAVSSIQHRGWLYFVYDIGTGDLANNYYNNGSHCLYRIKLDGSGTKECIANLEVGGNYQFLHMIGVGSYVYYILPDAEGFGEVYRFNTEALVNEKMDLGTITEENFCVMGNQILYKKDWESFELYSYDTETGKERLFVDLKNKINYELCRNIMLTDGTYIYVYCYDEDEKNGYHYIVLDKTGKVTADVNTGNEIGYHYGGGKDYMLYIPATSGAADIRFFRKELIGTKQGVLEMEGPR